MMVGVGGVWRMEMGGFYGYRAPRMDADGPLPLEPAAPRGRKWSSPAGVGRRRWDGRGPVAVKTEAPARVGGGQGWI